MPAPQESFDEFVAARVSVLLRFAHVLTGDRGLAEDLVQNVLINVHRRWDRIVRAGSPEAYCRQSLVNEYTSWRRRRRNAEAPGTVPDLAEADTSDVFAQRELVWGILARLPRRQRAVVVLRYYEAQSDAEIAALLGCAESTVRSLASRAFAVLRAHPDLEPMAPTDPDRAVAPMRRTDEQT
jgi:RNA polymerase sigma-70 factor (sigma-E family)